MHVQQNGGVSRGEELGFDKCFMLVPLGWWAELQLPFCLSKK